MQTQSVSIGVGETWSAFTSEKSTGRAVGAVIDLIVKGKAKSIPSTSMPPASLPPVRPASAPLRPGTSTNSVPGVNTGTIGPTPIARSPLKLAHILLHRSAIESEEEEQEEGSEGDELPTFHRGSAKSRAKKRATIARPAPRPFPMQLMSEPPVSPCASRLRERGGARYDDGNDDGDVIEIVDVFTTPRGLSPPRSPTPSPSPVKTPSVHALAGPVTFVKSKQPSGFPTSPTKSESQADSEPHKGTKQRRHASSDWDTRVSGNRDGILKSPRKSVAHSSPRHVSRAYGRVPSPTPGSASHANNDALWAGDTEGRNTSDSRGPEPEDSGSMQTGDCVGRKPRSSDASAIYISSGSEDEGNAGLVDNSRGGGQADVHGDQDECTDREADAWADTAMILSAPPSPARAPPPANDDLVPPFPAVEVMLPNPAHSSKFQPALAAVSGVGVRAQACDRTISTSLKGTTSDEDTVAPRPVRRAPLLVARAKRSKGRDDDVIDLTSD